MSPEEIHNFGIEVVSNYLKKDGYEIISVNGELGFNPQIIATKNGSKAFVVTRTACYPNNGILEDSTHFEMINFAEKHNATPYFASVGICNAEGKNEEEMSLPIKGGGFFVSYNGMLIITRSDRVKVYGKDGMLYSIDEKFDDKVDD